MLFYSALCTLGSLATAVAGLAGAQAAEPTGTPVQSASAGMVTQLHEFENGTWIENIAIRPNGQILLSLFDRPEIYLLDAFTPGSKPELLYKFANATRLTGLAEYAPDKFAVLVGARVNNKDVVSTHTLDLSSPLRGMKVNPVGGEIKGVDVLNGLTALSPDSLLASDSFGGQVFLINLKTGESKPVLHDATMMPGINGIRYRSPYLYFTNMVQGLFARIPIDPKTAESKGDAEVVATKIVGVDDFALATWTDREAYLVNFEQNLVLKVDSEANLLTFATGIQAPTSAYFGRTEADSRILYVVTSGGNGGGGKVVMVQT